MIVFGRDGFDAIVRAAEASNEREVCGVLGGRYGTDRSVVETVHEATNAAAQPSVRYELDPAEQLEILETIEEEGREVVGFYHSHPAGPPGPSPTDRERATWPDRSYVIVALDGEPFVGSWRWRADAGAFEPEVVSLTRNA